MFILGVLISKYMYIIPVSINTLCGNYEEKQQFMAQN